MIRRVTIRNFKRFREQAFELADLVVLAGPKQRRQVHPAPGDRHLEVRPRTLGRPAQRGQGRHTVRRRDPPGGHHRRAAPGDESPLGGSEGHRTPRHVRVSKADRDHRGRDRRTGSPGPAGSSSSTPIPSWCTRVLSTPRGWIPRLCAIFRRRRHGNSTSSTSPRFRASSATNLDATGVCRTCSSARGGRGRSCAISCWKSPRARMSKVGWHFRSTSGICSGLS